MAFASRSNKKHFCDNDLVIVLILNFDLPEQNLKSQPEANSKIQTKWTTDEKILIFISWETYVDIWIPCFLWIQKRFHPFTLYESDDVNILAQIYKEYLEEILVQGHRCQNIDMNVWYPLCDKEYEW